MIRRSMPQLPALLAATLLAVPVLLHDARPAQADARIRVRANADVRVRGNVRVRVGPRSRHHRVHTHRRHARPRARARVHVGGGLHWSGGVYIGSWADPRFAEPPPPPPPPASCDCSPRPAYTPYRPYRPYRQPAPPPTVAAAPAPAPPLPRLGIGVFAGSMNVDNRVEGEDVGLIGRLRLTDGLMLEGEVSRSEMDDSSADQRLGGALLYDFAPRSRFSLHVLGGAGLTQAEDAGAQSQQSYAELGAGLTYRLSSRLHLAADLRGGAQAPIEVTAAGSGTKGLTSSASEPTRFGRGRVGVFLYF